MLSDIFKPNKNSVRLILIMIVVTLIGIGLAKLYYDNLNRSKDPRTAIARELYKSYSMAVKKNDFDLALSSLNQMTVQYGNIPHYRESYEMGVVETYIAGIYLTRALYHSPETLEKNSNLSLAEKRLLNSIEIYKNWEAKIRVMKAAELAKWIRSDFSEIKENRETIIEKRIEDIQEALREIPRRYSGTYANLGIIKRHKGDIKGAIGYYQHAIKLWPENHDAINNLRVLMGKDPKKRGVIEKLFPKKRKQ